MSWRSWLAKSSSQAQAKDSFTNISDGEEDAAKAAILEKAFKGRQPTELMLRCDYVSRFVCFALREPHALTRKLNRHHPGRGRWDEPCFATTETLM
jgi:hypothetical protein